MKAKGPGIIPMIIILLACICLTAVLFYNIGARSQKERPTAVSVSPPLPPPVPAPVVIKKPRALRPRVAIVMDDLGYNVNNLDDVLAIGQPITFSVLPNLKFSRQAAKTAHQKGYEVILHLPMESTRNDVRMEPDTIGLGMGEEGILAVLEKDIDSVPYLTGVSNHMGSKATADSYVMKTVMGRLNEKDLYFFDSLVTPKTVCKGAAADAGIRFARRDVFIDNSSDPASIEKAMMDLRKIATKRGWAIGICHYRKSTIKVLATVMPKFAADGVEFVYLSELVK